MGLPIIWYCLFMLAAGVYHFFQYALVGGYWNLACGIIGIIAAVFFFFAAHGEDTKEPPDSMLFLLFNGIIGSFFVLVAFHQQDIYRAMMGLFMLAEAFHGAWHKMKS